MIIQLAMRMCHVSITLSKKDYYVRCMLTDRYKQLVFPNMFVVTHATTVTSYLSSMGSRILAKTSNYIL
jgi:hypothetical protein